MKRIIWDSAILRFYDASVMFRFLQISCIAVTGSLLSQICLLLHRCKSHWVSIFFSGFIRPTLHQLNLPTKIPAECVLFQGLILLVGWISWCLEQLKVTSSSPFHRNSFAKFYPSTDLKAEQFFPFPSCLFLLGLSHFSETPISFLI